MTVQNNEGGAALGLSKALESLFDPVDVIRITDAQHVPTVGEEPTCNVFGERDARVAFDRDVIVVVNPPQIVEPKMCSQGCSLRRDSFHQASVTADAINVVVEDVEARPVVAVGEPFFSDCHANACGHTLPEWAS